MIQRLLLLAMLAALGACATTPMNRAQCGAAEYCTLEGTLTPATAHDVDMASMQLADGSCVAVSLPNGTRDRLFESGPYATTIRGKVFADPGQNVVQIVVNQRVVASGICGGGFFVFVY